MRGHGSSRQMLIDYGVTHITVPWKHRHEFNIEFLNSIGTRVTSNGRYTVYEVMRKELATPVEVCDARC